MSLADFGKSMLRRWYAVLVCLALTAGGAYFVYQTVPVTYESSASVVLLPPSSLVTDEGNPYLYMGGLDQAVSVLVVKLNSADVAEELVHGDDGYEIAPDTSSPGPIIGIRTESATPERSARLRDEILDRLPDELEAMQDELSVLETARIHAMTVVSSSEPEVLAKEQMRSLLAVIAVGLGGTVLFTALLDRWMLARKDKPRKKDKEEKGKKVKGKKVRGKRVDEAEELKDPILEEWAVGEELETRLVGSGTP